MTGRDPRPDPAREIEQQELADFIAKRSDFSFEMRVTNIVRGFSDRLEHGGTYADPVTEKVRQFDIRAVLLRPDRILRLAIECKNYQGGHLVLSTVPRHPLESWLCVIGPDQSRMLPDQRNVQPSLLYPAGAPVGKATEFVRRRSKKQQGEAGEELEAADGETFDRISQALASAHELAGDMLQMQSLPRLTVPILVVPEGRLWQVDYKLDGSVLADVHPTSRVSLYVDRSWSFPGPVKSTLSAAVSHLEIVTIGALTQLVHDLATTPDVLAQP